MTLMKKEFVAVAAVILAVWFFLMGFEVGTYREKKAFAENPPANPTTAAEATAPTTTLPPVTAPPQTVTAPTTLPPITNDVTTTAAPVSDPTAPQPSQEDTTAAEPEKPEDVSSLSKDAIIKNMSEAINGAKAEQNMNAKKTESIKINVTDCSLPGATGLINNIINSLAGDEVISYAFLNGHATGITADGKEDESGSPKDLIPPAGKDFSLPSSGVREATAAKDGENTVYTVKLVEEKTTMEAPVPQYHSNAYGYLDLTSLDLTGVTITGADMHYPETTITATVDPSGKLVKLHFLMPMDGSGSAKILIGSGTATFEGSDDEVWEFTY